MADNQVKQLLESMAAQAAINNVATSGPLLPPGWVTLTTFAAKVPKPATPVQGFLAVGPVNDELAAVLALGITWTSFYFLNPYGTPAVPNDQMKLPVAVAGSTPPKAKISTVFVQAYNGSRIAIWNCLTYLTDQYRDIPLYITGMGLGAPIVQICSLDFRKGNTGPNKEDPPANVAPGYVFSALNIANTDFTTYYTSLITQKKMAEQYVVWAASSSLTADQFPTSPSSSDYLRLGTLNYIDDIRLPQFDEPWWERSDVYYLKSLGGEPRKNTVIPVSFSNQPAGFSRDMAYSASLMTAIAYQLSQHPDSTVTIKTAPYTLYKKISSGGTPFAWIFTSPDSVLVAFRGTNTFKEFYDLTCLSTFSVVSFISDTSVQAHAGTYLIYDSPVDGVSGQKFSEALIAELKKIAPQKKVYLAGHDIGGAVATLAATDYSTGNYGFDLTALYTFGGTCPGNISFLTYFNTKVGAKSYQLLRLKDKIPGALQPLGYIGVNNQINITGQLEIEESTYHSLSGYINLLNPT